MFSPSTTPHKITPDIIKLCQQIDSTREPIYVPVVPEKQSRFNDCFNNVEDKIRADGGTQYLKPGTSLLTIEEAMEYQEALMRLEEKYGLHNLKLGKNDICFCGSGKKYKKCHGSIIY
jgi:hypothetical protein